MPRMTRPQATRPSDNVPIYGVAAVLLSIGGFMALSDRAAAIFGAGPAASEADLFRQVAGQRTAWLGACIIALHRAGEPRPLGWALLLMAANPATDLALALRSGGIMRAIAHLPGAIATAGLGLRLLQNNPSPAGSE